jgi:UbiA prenyltransferase family
VIAWLKLLRLPNVFTAVADVMMGYLVTHGNLDHAWKVALLVAASSLLYLSGMVLNDAFDAEVDACEQPHRPIPSGKISVQAAGAVGWGMLASGTLIGWLVRAFTNDIRPGAIATLLAVCIVLYNKVLKPTPIAPLVMGACRALNVLLGMSLAPAAAARGQWILAAGIGIYVGGVTIFARTDARVSARPQLLAGLAVLLCGIGLLASAPGLNEHAPPLRVSPTGWLLLWAALAFITARRCIIAILDPVPKHVQAAVRHCVQSIIVLDAAVCVGYAGPFWGMIVLLLLIPTMLLTMWLDAT